VNMCVLLLSSTKRFLDPLRKLQHEQNALANAEQVFMNVRNDIKGAFEAAMRHTRGIDTPSGTSTGKSSTVS
jgi:hypothetical protein